MMEAQTLGVPVCVSCKRPILPGKKGAKFLCPRCGEITLWRDDYCRKQANPYKCPKCGFVGP